jgi:hypothetical protein
LARAVIAEYAGFPAFDIAKSAATPRRLPGPFKLEFLLTAVFLHDIALAHRSHHLKRHPAMFDDLKFILIFCFAPLAFLAWSSNFDMSPSQYDAPWRFQAPTVTFVPEGTPGAISAEEFKHYHYDSREQAWYRDNW